MISKITGNLPDLTRNSVKPEGYQMLSKKLGLVTIIRRQSESPIAPVTRIGAHKQALRTIENANLSRSLHQL
jgi:hypothetical protein